MQNLERITGGKGDSGWKIAQKRKGPSFAFAQDNPFLLYSYIREPY
jgi:hypothetical protein